MIHKGGYGNPQDTLIPIACLVQHHTNTETHEDAAKAAKDTQPIRQYPVWCIKELCQKEVQKRDVLVILCCHVPWIRTFVLIILGP